MYSRDNIKEAIITGSIKIYPFEEKNLTGIGYNLSTTHFAFSVNKGILLTVHRRTTAKGVEHFVIIPGKDTVLFFSKEYISVDSSISGTLHSKVSRVCQGLGHISTTLDPTWKGQLIVSVNNPTDKEICFELDRDSGNVLTLLFYKLDEPVTGSNIHDNNQGRCDLLLEHFAEVSSDEKYRRKHLELKEFVVNAFANSLNGYDEFVRNITIKDKYSKKVDQLLALQIRLKDEKVLFDEKRYLLGASGAYGIFRDEEEKKAIMECSIFKFFNISEEELNRKFSDPKDGTNEIIAWIDKYLSIINYELEMINHLRRIEWQNREIYKYASEDSELVKLQKHEEKKKFRRRFIFPLIGFLAAFVTAIFALYLSPIEDNLKSYLISGVIAFAGVGGNFLIHIYRKYKG